LGSQYIKLLKFETFKSLLKIARISIVCPHPVFWIVVGGHISSGKS